MKKKGRKKKGELKISGMHCASCVSSLEKALGSLEGLDNPHANLANETVSFEYDLEKTDLKVIKEKIRESGYETVEDRASFKVAGMTCAMCVKSLEKGLLQMEGIHDVAINLGTETVYVEFDPARTSLEAMARTVEETGYDFLGEESQATGEEKKEEEQKERAIRIAVGAITGLLLLTMMYLPFENPLPMGIVMFVLATPTFVYLSSPIFEGALKSLKNTSLNMDVMYAMGIGVAYTASVAATAGLLSNQFLFYETAVFLPTFLTIGRYLENKAKGRTSEALKKLINLRPKKATLIQDGEEKEVPVEMLQKGQTIKVRPGEKVPVDGIVSKGKSHFDESMVTGEPIPVMKSEGDEIIGGTLNREGVIFMEATKVGSETLLSQIIELVKKAQGTKPPLQRFADKVVSYFIPVVLAIALASFLFWFFMASAGFLFALTTTISILVIACPCALGLATPTAITVGVGKGAEMGILVKTGEALEASEKVDAIIFDKTGTITRGKPEVVDAASFGIDEKEMVKMAVMLERGSLHPYAEAVVSYGKKLNVPSNEAENTITFEGKGLKGTIRGKTCFIGNRKFIEENGGVFDPGQEEVMGRMVQKAHTIIILSCESTIRGVMAISDPLKSDSSQAIEKVKSLGMDVYMITGDGKEPAERIAKSVGIQNVLAEVLPQDKAREVKKLQKSGKKVAFVGDGINDAPALAQSDLGIAMGGGTDVAMESSGIVLIKGNLMDAYYAFKLGRKVMQRVKENIFWAFAYNALLIPVAAGILYPFFGITFRPEFAGAAMAMSSVTVVGLSLLLKRYDPTDDR